MSYIIVYTTNMTVAKTLFYLEHGRKNKGKMGRARPPRKDIIIHSLTGNAQGNVVKVFENNGLALTYVANLLKRYPNEVFVWVAERIIFNQLPELCKNGGAWLALEGGGRTLNNVHRYLNTSKEELEKCKIDILVNTKE